MSDTETVEDPYRTDPREAEIKELTNQVKALTKERAEMIERRDSTYKQNQYDINQLRERYERQIASLEGSSYVRGFGNLMMAVFTILWLLVNTAAICLPVYMVLWLHMDINWLHLIWLAAISFVAFYMHITSLSEKT